MTRAALAPLLAAAGGGLALAAATPPAWFPGAEVLVLVGLAAWYRLAAAGRSLWLTYLLGCVHLACFSWSVRHVLFFAWAMIVVLGGCYFVLASVALRAVGQRLRVAAFAVVVAGSFWLRANMPEIWYPHGQPCHVLWQWPALLGGVVVGGEALVNGLLAAAAAAACELGQSWRLAQPAWRAACRGLGVVAGVWIVATAGGVALGAGRAPAGDERVAVAAVEPGFHLVHELRALPAAQRSARYRELFEARLLAPTRTLLAAGTPPDVVLWPESSLAGELPLGDVAAGHALLPGRLPASPARLLLGINVRGDGPPTPAAVLVELPGGRTVAHQEKRCLVPGGETQPFVHWLPDAAVATLRAWFEQALGSMPEATPGRELPPLRCGRGVPFGALLCYDNAFPGPSRAQVAQGARWLAVLSNESWYEGGAELTQLMAMTVVRALETGTPVVRCTQDGWSGFVDGGGTLREALPLRPAPQPGPQVLRVEVPLGPGRLPPLEWLRQGLGPSAAAALGALLLCRLLRGVARRGSGAGGAVAAAGAPPAG